MATLLMPLCGPLQSWGVDARFGQRQTLREPSKSGVIGLICAALGRDRHDAIDDLADLRFGTRVDRGGTLLRDYHTVLDVIAAGNKTTGTVLSDRWYLADAAFLAGLEGDSALLAKIRHALADPVWPLFLGRKSCPPACSLAPDWGLSTDDLRTALTRAPALEGADLETPFRLVIEDPQGDQSRPDQPAGPFARRRFVMRRVSTEVLAWNSHG
jgi:CRISPR system Cascade subunit CasD